MSKTASKNFKKNSYLSLNNTLRPDSRDAKPSVLHRSNSICPQKYLSLLGRRLKLCSISDTPAEALRPPCPIHQ